MTPKKKTTQINHMMKKTSRKSGAVRMGPQTLSTTSETSLSTLVCHTKYRKRAWAALCIHQRSCLRPEALVKAAKASRHFRRRKVSAAHTKAYSKINSDGKVANLTARNTMIGTQDIDLHARGTALHQRTHQIRGEIERLEGRH